MIVATGIDIVEIERIRGLVRGARNTFVKRWFSDEEIAYCEQTADPSLHYAVRIAAKEATVKALGIEWDGPICWRDISVSRAVSDSPTIVVTGFASHAMRRREIATLHVSLSQTSRYAVASVIAERQTDI